MVDRLLGGGSLGGGGVSRLLVLLDLDGLSILRQDSILELT